MSAAVRARQRGEVTAVRFTGDLKAFRQGVLELCGGDWECYTFEQGGVVVAVVSHPEEPCEFVRDGDWLVRGPVGGIWTIEGERFARDYEIAP